MNHLNISTEKTIAAISTPHGVGGIGVIRISGADAIKIADKIFVSKRNNKLADLKGYTASYGHVIEAELNQKIDDVVALVFRAPHSYTGEDVVEISCHGGLYTTKKVLDVILCAGANLATPGEFTKRAFLNNKLTLTQAEAVMDIIGAKGKKSARIAQSTHEGRLYKEIRSILNVLIEYTAHLSVWADYPEEDIQQLNVEMLKTNLSKVSLELQNLLDNYDSGKVIRDGLNTVIVGRPNVGKSTLMNLLSGYECSIVTQIPGTTRDIVQESVMIADIMLILSDTAGIRQSDDIIENMGVKKAYERLSSADLALAVFDYSDSLSSEDFDLLEKLKNKAIPCIAIINKTDLDKKIDDDYIKKYIPNVIYLSASSGEGLNDLKQALEKITNTENIESNYALLSNERQKQACDRALVFLKDAINGLDIGMTLDAVTVAIESAIDSLLELTGEKVSDVVVDEIFSKFCVGK